MNTTHATLETGSAVAAKTAPPITVSLATLAGYNVSELLVWATLIYTVLMISHKLYSIVQDVRDRHMRSMPERRTGEPDNRQTKLERRAP